MVSTNGIDGKYVYRCASVTSDGIDVGKLNAVRPTVSK